MNPNLTQLGKIDLVVKGMESLDMKVEQPFSKKKRPSRVTPGNWQGASMSPYRAAYLEYHGFDDLGIDDL